MYFVYVVDSQGQQFRCTELITSSPKKKFQCGCCHGDGARLSPTLGAKCPICDSIVERCFEVVDGHKPKQAVKISDLEHLPVAAAVEVKL